MIPAASGDNHHSRASPLQRLASGDMLALKPIRERRHAGPGHPPRRRARPSAARRPGDGNNEAFLAGSVVMTPNPTLSIPGALRTARPEDYYGNAVTLPWPSGARGQPFATVTFPSEAAVFGGAGHKTIGTE